MRRPLVLGTLLALASLSLGTAAVHDPDSGFIEHLQKSVTRADGARVIRRLASDEFQGRMTGQPGQHMTAEMGALVFKEAGLLPTGDPGDYLQHFTTYTSKIDDATLSVDGKDFAFGTNFISRGDGGFGNVTADAVYVGWGISDPDQGYDEYKGIDATGKIVVALRGTNPGIKGDWQLTGWKVRAAKAHGAVGLVLLGAHADGSWEGLIGSVYFSNGDIPWDPSFPAVQADKDVAAALFGKRHLDLRQMVEFAQTQQTPVSLNLGATVHLAVSGTMNLNGPTENVCGLLEGSDPVLKNEVIVVGGHMDHVGMQGKDLIFCGQEDNASGTATVMALARAFGTFKTHPRRSILFMLFTGEEMGLVGSKYWVAHPTLPLNEVKAMFQYDMDGGGDSFVAHNAKNTPQIDALDESANARLYHLKYDATDEAEASDHASFWHAGIPAVMILNGGDRQCPVHQLAHFKPDGSNLPLWEEVSETTGLVIWDLANADAITDTGPKEDEQPVAKE